MAGPFTGDSAELVAMDLLQNIANAEGMVFHGDTSGGQTTATRKWILDTYAECIQAVKEPHLREP